SVPHASITGFWVGEDSAFNANGTGVYAPPCAGLPYLGYRLQAVQSGDTVTFTGTEFCDPHDTVGQYGPVTVVASHDTLFKTSDGYYWGQYLATDTIFVSNAPYGVAAGGGGTMHIVRQPAQPAPPPSASPVRLAGVYLTDTIPNCKTGFQQLKLAVRGPIDPDSSVYQATSFSRDSSAT